MFELLLLSFEKDLWLDIVLIIAMLLLSSVAALHAVVYKRESRAAIGWFGLIVASPILGSLLYYFLGINRVERKARRLKLDGINPRINIKKSISETPRFRAIRKTGESLSYSPACGIDSIHPLNTGDEAYPSMLEAIGKAQKTICLFSYIFTVDPVGREFLNRLQLAMKNGVQVRLMVDGVGSKKTLSLLKELCKEKAIPLAVFLPVLWRPSLANLRNHRKILVVDGEVAFTGGLNVAECYWPSRSENNKIKDFHFRLEGPIANDLQQVFSDDWFFSTGEELAPEVWQSKKQWNFESHNLARVVVDGPGDQFEKMRWHFLSAINAAQKHIRIATPYFLPESGVRTALISAALRGVHVDVLVPQKGDHKILDWAFRGSSWEILNHGVHLWLSPPPFDHSKIFVVDDDYCSVGSSNWDPRSLRLNFEMNVELYHPKLAQKLIKVYDEKKSRAKPYTLDEHEKRPYPVKVRDGFARMFSPYL